MSREHWTLALAGVLASLALVAGCTTDAGPDTDALEDQRQSLGVNASTPRAWIEVADPHASGIDAVTWNGSKLEATGSSECPSDACQRVEFTVSPNASGGDLGTELVVSASWDPYRFPERGASSPASLGVRVETPDGRTVQGDSLLWGAAAIVDEPEAGTYAAEIRAREGSTAYVGAVQVQNSSATAGEKRLPDLVMMPVFHLSTERVYSKYGAWFSGDEPVDEATGTSGCSPYEATERGARNCLRFTTSIGNRGEGPLEVRLSFENATRAAVPAVESRFTQAIYRDDGSVRLVEAGRAEYHPAHEHYHKRDMAAFTLYAYDDETDTRGEVITEGHKTSWCLVDMGLVEPAGPSPVETPRYPLEGSRTEPGQGSNCEAATPQDDMVTGVSAGWYDMYEWFVPDQYVEVTDLPEGTYELVAEANPKGTVVESHPDNNAAGVVFEWADGQPTVLERWSEGLEG